MTFPTSPSNEDYYTNANGTKYQYDSTDDKWVIVSTCIGTDNHTAMITPSADRDPGGSTWSVVYFDNNFESDSSVVDADASSNRIQVKIAGWYLIMCSVRQLSYAYAPGTANYRLTKNGTAMADCYFSTAWESSNNYYQQTHFSTVKQLAVNDYIKLESMSGDLDYNIQNEGTNLTVTKLI